MGAVDCDNHGPLSQWDLQSQFGKRPVCNTCLTAGQAIGLAFSAQAGAISFISVLALFAIVLIKYYRGSPTLRAKPLGYIDVFMINLFLGELLMALGGILDGKWANETQVYCGGYCDAQGNLQFLGETSVSIWTLCVTIYTWWSLTHDRVLGFQPLICCAIVAAVWLYVLAFNFGSYASMSSYFTPGPFWCWVNPNYDKKRLGEYIWLWMAGAGNIVVYVPLYLLLRGNLVLGDGLFSVRFYWAPPPQTESAAGDRASVALSEAEEENAREDAFKLLWYPIVYTVLVLPLSIVRWMGSGNDRFKDPQIPEMRALATAQLVFHALYRLSGAVNVGLLLGTRPHILFLGEDRRQPEPEKEDYSQHSNGSQNLGDGAPLRRRFNLTHGEEPTTGFGGPVVTLGIDEERGGR